jgi:hypothetical protein
VQGIGNKQMNFLLFTALLRGYLRYLSSWVVNFFLIFEVENVIFYLPFSGPKIRRTAAVIQLGSLVASELRSRL